MKKILLTILAGLTLASCTNPLDNSILENLNDETLLSYIEKDNRFEGFYNIISDFKVNKYDKLPAADRVKVKNVTYSQLIDLMDFVNINRDSIMDSNDAQLKEVLNSVEIRYHLDDEREKYALAMETMMKDEWKSITKHYKGFTNPYSDKINNFEDNINAMIYNADSEYNWKTLIKYETSSWIDDWYVWDYIYAEMDWKAERLWEITDRNLAGMDNNAYIVFKSLFYNSELEGESTRNITSSKSTHNIYTGWKRSSGSFGDDKDNPNTFIEGIASGQTVKTMKLSLTK